MPILWFMLDIYAHSILFIKTANFQGSFIINMQQSNYQFQFPPNILKSLIDKNQEKRESACKELEIIVRKNADKKRLDMIEKIIIFFREKYVRSFDLSKKIAGLEALPSIINGIQNFPEGVSKFAHVIVTAILDCLNESEHKVRWTSLKSLYYISKTLDDRIIEMFNMIFQKIIGKINDLDDVVKGAANFLDKQLQSILSSSLSSSEGCQSFNLEEFMNIVKSKLKSMNPGVREFLIKWISNLNQIMTVDLLIYLPDLLEDLLFMLGDKQKNLRQSAEECLHNFEKEMVEKFNEGKLEIIMNEEIINKITSILIKVAKGKFPSYTKLHTLSWFKTLFTFFKAQIEVKMPKSLMNNNKFYFKKVIIDKFDEVLQPILVLMSHEEEEVRKASLNANDLLMQNIQMINREETINFSKVMPLLKDMLSEKKSTSTSESALKWMKFMLENYNDKILPEINDIIEKLVEKLCDSNVKNVISIIENTRVTEEYFELLIEKMLFLLLNKAPNEHEERFEQILRKFSSILEADKFCKSICCQMIKTFENKLFIFEIVHYLNILIINESSMLKMRRRLQNWNEPDYREFFMVLFQAFKYNPAAAVSLCLLAQQYELAYRILIIFGTEQEMSSQHMMGFCKLATLIQSPGFLFLRLQILQKNDPYLLESLTSLLMILPQGKIFNMLKNRLDVSKIISSKDRPKILKKQLMRENQLDLDILLKEYKLNQLCFIK